MLKVLMLWASASFLLSVVSEAQSLADFEKLKATDWLGRRVVLRKLAVQGMDALTWLRVREWLHAHPQVGWDLIFLWDQKLRPKSAWDEVSFQVEKNFRRAEALATKKDFPGARKLLLNLMREVANQPAAKSSYFYSAALHRLARSFFGEAKYEQSLKVYEWIPLDYPFLRQVLFEKMWAAFHSQRWDVLLGSLNAQRSVYFSPYLEPESYLLELYTAKKLCEPKWEARSQAAIKAFRAALADPKQYSLEIWARKDLVATSLYKLSQLTITEQPKSEAYLLRAREQRRIFKLLNQAYARDRVRLKSQIEVVLSYFDLALSGSSRTLSPSVSRLDPLALLRDEFEIWPRASGEEEWIDELNHQVYLGPNRCRQRE